MICFHELTFLSCENSETELLAKNKWVLSYEDIDQIAQICINI